MNKLKQKPKQNSNKSKKNCKKYKKKKNQIKTKLFSGPVTNIEKRS